MANIRRDAPMADSFMVDGASRAKEKSGAGAVKLSVQQNSMQANTIAVAREDKDEEGQILIRNTVNNQFVANKNFTSSNNVWIDSDFTESSKLPEVLIKFASDEYFRLISTERELLPYLSLGQQVVVVWKGKVYRITN